MLVGHTLSGVRVKGLPLLHMVGSSISEPRACGFVCHPQTPRIVNSFSAKRGAIPRSVIFPSSVIELFEDVRRKNDSPVLGVRTLDSKVYFFPLKEYEREVPPHKKAKSLPRPRTIFAGSPSQLLMNNVVSMRQFPCVLCKNEVILFGKDSREPPLTWKVPTEVCGSSLTEYVWVQDTSKVAPELIYDLSLTAGCIKYGKQKSKGDLIVFGDSLGHVFWTRSPDGEDRKTENPQVFYTSEGHDPICRIFMVSRSGGTLLDTMLIVTAKGSVKVLWWKHADNCCKSDKKEEVVFDKMEFQFQIDEENISKSTICFSNGKILVSSSKGGIKIFDPFLQAQAFGVREKTSPTASLIHQDWDVWAVTDEPVQDHIAAAIIVTRDGRIISEGIQKDAPSSLCKPKVFNTLKPLIASTKALSCQEKVFGGIGDILWSHLSVTSEVLEVLRIARGYPNTITAEINLASADLPFRGLSIECKLCNKSIVKLSRDVWSFHLSIYSVSSSSPGHEKLQKFTATIPITEDISPDAVWSPPNAIFLEDIPLIGPPFIVESFLTLSRHGLIEKDEDRQRLLTAKISAKAGLPAPLFMRKFAPSVAISLGEKRVFGGFDLLCIRSDDMHLGGDKGFDVASIGFERRLGTALLHQVTETFQERSKDKKGPFPIVISLPGTKGDPIASVSLVQENTVTFLRIRASRKHLFGIHAALLFDIVQCLDKVGIEPDPHQMEWRSAILRVARDLRASVGDSLHKFENLEQEYMTSGSILNDVRVQTIGQIVADIYKFSNKWILSDLCRLTLLS